MSEAAKATAVKFFEEQDRLRGGPAEPLCADGYTAHLAGFPPMDLEGHTGFAAAFYGAFPDMVHTIERVIGEGARAAVRFRLTGTHTADFMGIPASGKPVDVGAIALLTVVSGKVTELYAEFDQAGLLQQIGAMPAN